MMKKAKNDFYSKLVGLLNSDDEIESEIEKKEILYISSLEHLVEVEYRRCFSANKEELLITVKSLCYFNFNQGIFFTHNIELGKFSITADINEKVLFFGPKGRLGKVPKKFQNNGIGTYCMVNLIKDFSIRYKDFQIKKGKLSIDDAKNDDERDNRNFFYKRLGFNVNLYDNDTKGSFNCQNINNLTKNWNTDKIKVVSTKFYLSLLSKAISDNYEKLEISKDYKNFKNNVIKMTLAFVFILAVIISLMVL